MPPNYDNGKIYRILCPDGYFYIGSTVTTLSVRMNGHKQKSKKVKRKLYNHINSNNGWDGVVIELLEEFPCTTARELTAREDYYICSHKSNPKCLNEKRSHVTPEEYIESHHKYAEENKEYIDAYQAQYRLKNAEKRREYSRQYAKDHPEEKKAKRKQHYQENKEHVYQKCKEYNEAHKDKIREYKTKWSRNKRAEGAEDRKKKALARKEATAAKRAYEATIVQCDCGGTYRNDKKARHYATQKHMKFQEGQDVFKPQNEVIEPEPKPELEPEPVPKLVAKRPRKIKILEA